ncbi:MAG TPA: mannonate dehydratase [Longimicrobium sp.]|nr:mannonate dehydratase [Longimicrobium sp.]
MTFRWFGADDPVPLQHIRQVPGVEGIVTSLYHLPPGEVWPRDELAGLTERIAAAGLRFSVVESIPVHEEIKLGGPARDPLIDAFAESVRRVGEIGVPVVCYNFMPVFDWTRTELEMPLADGSAALAYDDGIAAAIDLSHGTGDLPGWAAAYDGPTLARLRHAYARIDGERMWQNLAYFLERVIPVAQEAGVKMAIHPDDPPWPIFGLPRIVTDGDALERVTRLVDSPANGLAFCTGSLGALPSNDLPAMIRRVGHRIHFAHCRNVRVTGERRFHETAHPSRFGSVDMLEVMRALTEVGFDGPMRPDHGRRIWGEQGRPGYGLYDRALGAAYLQGLWEAVSREPG